MTNKEEKIKEQTPKKVNECFVIMPIADPDGYEKGHFEKVYEDIFKPACQAAGFVSLRADEVKQTNLIHLDILQKLIESPMAICDLSSRNPNVLFELGLRQAFDKPTVLVQEIGTPRIFDIAPLRYTEYRKELKYRDVLEDQRFIKEALVATESATKKGEGVNSIISILSLSRPASLKEVNEGDTSALLQMVRAEMSELRSDFRKTIYSIEKERFNERDKFPKNRIVAADNMNYRYLEEIKNIAQEAVRLSEAKGDPELIIKLTNKAQSMAVRVLEGDIQSGMRSDLMHFLSVLRHIETSTLENMSK